MTSRGEVVAARVLHAAPQMAAVLCRSPLAVKPLLLVVGRHPWRALKKWAADHMAGRLPGAAHCPCYLCFQARERTRDSIVSRYGSDVTQL